jgi:hypothetical protein
MAIIRDILHAEFHEPTTKATIGDDSHYLVISSSASGLGMDVARELVKLYPYLSYLGLHCSEPERIRREAWVYLLQSIATPHSSIRKLRLDSIHPEMIADDGDDREITSLLEGVLRNQIQHFTFLIPSLKKVHR